MKTVSDEFIAEQNKPISRGIRGQVTIKALYVDPIDLTPYLMHNTLTRVELNVEESLTAFGSPDIQFRIWYNQDIWNYIHDNEGRIEIEVRSGFDFEKPIVFSGYVDKQNVKLDTQGTMYLRAYSQNTYAKTVVVKSGSYGSSAPRYMSIKDVVTRLYQLVYVNDSDIRVAPIDIDGYAWSEFHSYVDIDKLVLDKKPYFIFNDHTIIYWNLRTHPIWQWVATVVKLEFNEDYSDFTETINYEYGTMIVEIIRWDSEHVGVVYGKEFSAYYKGGSTAYQRDDYELTKIRIYAVEDWSMLKEWDYTRSTSGGYEYIPMAKSVRRIEGKNRFVIGWNAKKTSSPYWIEKCTLEMRNASDNSIVSPSWAVPNAYIHPYTQSARGYGVGSNKAWYGILLNENSAWMHNLYIARYIWDAWAVSTTTGNALNWEGRLTGFGKYLCNDGGRVINMETFQYIPSGFWIYFPEYVYTTWDQTSNKHTLVGYDITSDSIQMRVFQNGQHGSVELIDPDEIIPTGRYTEQVGATGFFFDDNGNHNFIFGMRSNPEPSTFLTHWSLFGSKFFPYVDSHETFDRSVRTNLDELAKAFCCTHHFPTLDFGIFLSRTYLPEDINEIPSSLIHKKWCIQTFEPRKVIVNGTEYGDGEDILEITSAFIIDDEEVREAIAKLYYDFMKLWNYLLDFKADFLIQYEPLDVIRITNLLDGHQYEGRITKSIQEKINVRFVMRGKKL